MFKIQCLKVLVTTMVLSTTIAQAQIKIKLSRNLPSNQENLLLRDFEVLKNMKFKYKADEETFKVMGIRNLNNKTYIKWLEDRVQYIIEDMNEDDIYSSILTLSNTHRFDNIGEFPEYDTVDEEVEKNPNVMTIMSNMGSALYEMGKDMNILLGMKFKESLWSSEIIKFSSPRTGMIMVGEGHFHERFLINKHNHKATSNSLSRLATLYHEARHSDGAGINLGFGHAVCPKGHDYYNFYACDKTLNGPYSIDVVVMKEMIKNCNDCTLTDKEKFKMKIIDAKNRVIKEYDEERTSVNDEMVALELRLKLLKMSSGLDISTILKKKDQVEIQEINEKLAILKEANTISTHKISKHIDPSPEGRRLK